MIKHCQRCSEEFSARWNTQKLCNDCYKESVKTTVPASESSHPALVAERQPKPPQPERADPEHVKRLLAELTFEIETKERASEVSQIRCEHTFVGDTTPQCSMCGMFYEQFWYCLSEPRTKLNGGPW